MRSYIDANQHDFAVLRESGALYVDKTRQIHELLRSGSARMYTRPRRFGKSLLLSTVAALYRGEEALFAGMLAQPEPLWIHHTGMWDWERQQRPVLQLTMNRLELEPDGTAAAAFSALLRDTADSWGMTGCYILDDNPLTAWGNLLRAVARSYQPDAARSPEARAGLPLPEPGHYEFAWLPPPLAQSRPGARGGLVLLIDEYDAPILNHLGHPQAAALRRLLAGFYEATKIRMHLFHRLLLTGVTRFVREGLWSKLNHVTDVTADPYCHDLTGFTDEELDSLTRQLRDGLLHVQHTDSSLKSEALRTAWREWYNGYRFTPDAQQRLYNPWFILHSLGTGRLRDYWYDSGHLGALTDVLT